MNRKITVIVSKDAMCKDYLHFYGEKKGQFPTPNLDALIEQGTIFNRHYTAAPSTVMSFYSMVTGKFAHETEFQLYEKCHKKIEGETFFSKLKAMGYDECHFIWDEMWNILLSYYDYFQDIEVHAVEGLRESVGVHKQTNGPLFADDEKAHETLDQIEKLFASLVDNDKNVFVWMHLPHVLSGRACYGADIDMFDEYVGMVRRHVPDNCIVVTADHGNMNGSHGKLAYGFDVYNKSAAIPFITPRIEGLTECNYNTSSVDLFDIIINHRIPKREFVYTDSAYRAQKNRKLAIIYGNYKYIYNKYTKKEELYDLEYDPDESFSLMEDVLFDVDRKINIVIREEYFYPRWPEIAEIRAKMRTEKEKVWRNGSWDVVAKSNIKDIFRPAVNFLEKLVKK